MHTFIQTFRDAVIEHSVHYQHDQLSLFALVSFRLDEQLGLAI